MLIHFAFAKTVYATLLGAAWVPHLMGCTCQTLDNGVWFTMDEPDALIPTGSGRRRVWQPKVWRSTTVAEGRKGGGRMHNLQTTEDERQASPKTYDARPLPSRQPHRHGVRASMPQMQPWLPVYASPASVANPSVFPSRRPRVPFLSEIQ